MIINCCLKIFLLLLLTFSKAHAQDHWTVLHNKKKMLNATAEDTTANQVVLKHGDLKKWGSLRIRYTEMPERTAWKRSLLLSNAGGAELQRASKKKLHIRNRILRNWARQNRRLFIYTTSIPTDPAVAATVRMRPVHLCTVMLQD